VILYVAENAIDKEKNNKYHFGHIEERLGLLTIIVLGESMLAVVYAFKSVIEHFSTDLFTLAASSVLILFSMWWLYFDDFVEDKLANKKKSFIWGYGHYFIYGFATAVGILISVNVDVLTDHVKIDGNVALAVMAFVIAGYLVSVWLCHDYLLDKKGLKRYELLILAASIVGVALLAKSVFLISIIFVALIVLRLTRKHRQLKRQYIS